jgi:hypothetical protein
MAKTLIHVNVILRHFLLILFRIDRQHQNGYGDCNTDCTKGDNMNFLKFVFLLVCGDFIKTEWLFGASNENAAGPYNSSSGRWNA